MDDSELLELFGFTDASDIRAEDCDQLSIPGKLARTNMAAAMTYNLYQQLGVDGLRGLSNFNSHSGVSAPRVETVLVNKPPPSIFVHANTFLDGDTVTLKEYEPTIEGVLESWAERKV